MQGEVTDDGDISGGVVGGMGHSSGGNEGGRADK